MDSPVAESGYGKQGAPALPLESTTGSIPSTEEFDTAKAVNYSVANLGASVFYGLFNFGMPLFLNSYALPAWLVGLLANERSFVGAFVQPVVGRLSDKLRTPIGRRRPFFLAGIPLTCVGLFLLAGHPPLAVMIGIMAVLAFFLAIAWDPYTAMMADLFPPAQRGRVGGLLGLGSALGNIIFALMALYLWSSNEFLAFCIVIVMLIATWGYTFFKVKEPPIAYSAEVEKPPKTKADPVRYFKELLHYPEAAKYTLAVNFFWMGTGGVVPFITLFAVKALHATQSESFILPLAATVTGALCAVPAGYLADRTSKKTVMFYGMLLLGLAAIIGSQSQTVVQGTIALAFLGAANSAMAQINPMLTDLVPRKRMAEFVGLGSAVFSFSQPIGSVVAGLVVGIATPLVGVSDAYRWSFICAGALVITSAFLLRTVHPERVIQDEDDLPEMIAEGAAI